MSRRLSFQLISVLVWLLPVDHFAVAADGASCDREVARTKSAVACLSDIDASLLNIPTEDRGAFMDNPFRLERHILRVLRNKALAAEARKIGLHRDPRVVRLLDYAVDEFLSRVYLEYLVSEGQEPDFEAAARERYLSDQNLQRTAELKEVSHILLPPDQSGEGLKLAHEIKRKIVSGELSFEEAVERWSVDTASKRKKGSVGIVDDSFDEEFRKAAAALERPGEVGGPIITPFGIHLIRLDNIIPSRKLSFEEVKDRLVTELRTEWMQRTRGEAAARFEREEIIAADRDLLLELRTRYNSRKFLFNGAGQQQ